MMFLSGVTSSDHMGRHPLSLPRHLHHLASVDADALIHFSTAPIFLRIPQSNASGHYPKISQILPHAFLSLFSLSDVKKT